MSMLQWDKISERYFEIGVDRCVLYVKDGDQYLDGVAWNGVTSLTESPSGADPTPVYADDMKWLGLFSKEDFAATIEAYSYPDEFAECDGSIAAADGAKLPLQNRKMFGLCYRTKIGNDTVGTDYAYKLHFIYNCKASPSEETHQGVNDTPEPVSFSWNLSSIPVPIDLLKETSHIIVDSRKVSENALRELEAFIYGSSINAPTFPTPQQIKQILKFDGSYLYSITDTSGDGDVNIYPRNPRVKMYSFTDDYNDGNVVITCTGERLYSCDDPEDNGEVVIEVLEE